MSECGVAFKATKVTIAASIYKSRLFLEKAYLSLPLQLNFSMPSSRSNANILFTPIHIPGIHPLPTPRIPILVPRTISGSVHHVESVSFQLLHSPPNAPEWQKAPHVRDLLEGRVQLVDANEKIWATRRMYEASILWELDWPGLFKPVPIDEPSFQSGTNLPMTRQCMAIAICHVLQEAVNPKPWPTLTKAFEPMFSSKEIEAFYLKRIRLDKVRLASLDCVYDYGKGKRRWCPKFYIDV